MSNTSFPPPPIFSITARTVVTKKKKKIREIRSHLKPSGTPAQRIPATFLVSSANIEAFVIGRSVANPLLQSYFVS
jgi:hypothetical protein